MKTFSFSNLPPLRDFQFLTDSSGYVLTQSGQLYQFENQRTTLVKTPEQFVVSHFYFRDQMHGAVVGIAPAAERPVRKATVGVAALPLLLLAWLIWRNYRGRSIRNWRTHLGLLVVSGALTLSCSSAWQRYRVPDPGSRYANVLTQPLLTQPFFHHYVGNKGQQSFIALTHNQGGNWQTQLIPSNFYPTALTALDRTYLVGTYAREQAGTVPLHGDGDIWLYGADAAPTPQLAAPARHRPYCIKMSRGVTGFLVSAPDSALYVFGSDRMPTLPSTVMSATPGNIYVVPTSLKPPTKLIDAPDTVDVRSLSRADNGDLWTTLAGRRPYLSHGNLGYVALPTKKLLRLRAGQWRTVVLPPFTSFEQVEFVPGTRAGYALAEKGEMLETQDDGDTWHPLPNLSVHKMHAWHHAITWLQGAEANQLVLCQTPVKK